MSKKVLHPLPSHDKQWYGNEAIRPGLEGPFFALNVGPKAEITTLEQKLRGQRRFVVVYPRGNKKWLVWGALSEDEAATMALIQAGLKLLSEDAEMLKTDDLQDMLEAIGPTEALVKLTAEMVAAGESFNSSNG